MPSKKVIIYRKRKREALADCVAFELKPLLEC